MTNEEVKRWIWAKCEEEGDCLIWRGAMAGGTVPQVNDPDAKKTRPARRLLLEALGRNIKGKVATTKCGNPACMAEDHVVAWSRKRLQERSGKKSAGSLSRKMNVATAVRKRSRLTIEDIREARAGMNYREVMERFGVAKPTAHAILSGKIWKDYSSPFAGLFTGLAANDSKRKAA